MILFQMIPLHTFVENFLPPIELTTEHINFWEQQGYTSAQTLVKRNVLDRLISLEAVRAVNAAEMNRDSLCGQLNYMVGFANVLTTCCSHPQGKSEENAGVVAPALACPCGSMH